MKYLINDSSVTVWSEGDKSEDTTKTIFKLKSILEVESWKNGVWKFRIKDRNQYFASLKLLNTTQLKFKFSVILG